MKTFTYHIGGQTLNLTLSEQQGTLTEVTVDGAPYVPAPDEMPQYAAAICLALIEHDTAVVHDEETGIITLAHHDTPWNSPAEMMTQL